MNSCAPKWLHWSQTRGRGSGRQWPQVDWFAIDRACTHAPRSGLARRPHTHTRTHSTCIIECKYFHAISALKDMRPACTRARTSYRQVCIQHARARHSYMAMVVAVASLIASRSIAVAVPYIGTKYVETRTRNELFDLCKICDGALCCGR